VRYGEAAAGYVFARRGEGSGIDWIAASIERNDVEANIDGPTHFGSAFDCDRRAGMVAQ
jgi:hypothetical protein